MDIKFFLRNLWLWKQRKLEMNFEKEEKEELKKTQWSEKFEKLMKNRMIVGGYRYGPENKKQFNINYIKHAISLLNSYLKREADLEYLVDAANMCLLEFMLMQGENNFFKAKDDKDHAEVCG